MGTKAFTLDLCLLLSFCGMKELKELHLEPNGAQITEPMLVQLCSGLAQAASILLQLGSALAQLSSS